jgi:N-acetylmuramoyl-L-alanine amidase
VGVDRGVAAQMRETEMKNPMRFAAALLAAALLAGCHTIPTTRNPMAAWVRSPNYDVRRPVLVVVHFTEEDSVEQALHTLRNANSGGKVSAHYLVGKDGKIYQLVPDELRAWQAGAGRWGTITDVNSASIGIEIDNDGHTPYPDAQIDSVIALLGDLCKRWRIPPTQVIGHADLAPGRKPDPGKLFPWKRLHDAGFGIWPAADAPPAPAGFDVWRALAQVGYSLDNRAGTVRAFHQHFRGDDGETLDAEDARILYSLTQPAGAGTESPAPADAANPPQAPAGAK